MVQELLNACRRLRSEASKCKDDGAYSSYDTTLWALTLLGQFENRKNGELYLFTNVTPEIVSTPSDVMTFFNTSRNLCFFAFCENRPDLAKRIFRVMEIWLPKQEIFRKRLQQVADTIDLVVSVPGVISVYKWYMFEVCKGDRGLIWEKFGCIPGEPKYRPQPILSELETISEEDEGAMPGEFGRGVEFSDHG
jgi:hypothetical protein